MLVGRYIQGFGTEEEKQAVLLEKGITCFRSTVINILVVFIVIIATLCLRAL